MNTTAFPYPASIDTPMTTLRAIVTWAEAFARCVRNHDFEAGRSLFSANVHSFGTRTPEARDLDQLHSQQWAPTWIRTRDFTYTPDSLHTELSDDGTMAMLIARWQSIGVDTPDLWANQTPYLRTGRCTFILKQCPDSIWRCIHTHFSMDPDPKNPA